MVRPRFSSRWNLVWRGLVKLHTLYLMTLAMAVGLGACRPRQASTSGIKDHESAPEPGGHRPPLQFTSSFAVPERILPNQSTTLHWCAVGADYVEISGFEGRLPACAAGASMLRVFPPSSQDYHIRAFRGTEEVTRVLTAIVMPLPGLVRSIAASTLPVLEGAETTLLWFAETCDYVVVSDDSNFASQPIPCGEGRLAIRPTTATNYTVRAFRHGNGHLNAYYGGTWQDQLVGLNSLRVEVLQRTPQVYFEVNPREIMEDEFVNISWSVQDAEQISLTPLGAVPPQGTKTHSPKVTTEYRLTATRAGMAPQHQSVTVVVKPKLKIGPIAMTPLDGVIKAGEAVNFNWSTEWCRHVRLELASGERVSDDRACANYFSVTPRATTDYFLRVEDLYGAVQRLPFRVVVVNEPQVAIPVAQPAPAPAPSPAPTPAAPPAAAARPVVVENPADAPSVVEFSASRTDIFEGETIRLTWSSANAKRAFIKFPRRIVEVATSGDREFKVKNSGIIEIYAENDRFRSMSRKIQVSVTPLDRVDELFRALQTVE